MKLHTRYTINAQFSMASMTDLIFLLLIFFMLTLSNSPTGLAIELPKSGTSTEIRPQINISITSTLDYYVNETKIPLGQLRNTLESMLIKKSLVLLLVDESVPILHMIKVVDIATALGAKVSVATKPA